MQSKTPDQQKNLLLAIVLSMGVLLLWQVFYAGPKMKEEQDRLARLKQEQAQSQTAQPGAAGQAPAAPAAGSAATGGVVPGAAGAVTATLSRDQTLALAPRVAIETPAVKGSISLRGGRIDDLKLVRYREQVDPKSANIELFSPAGAPSTYFAEHGYVAPPGTTIALPGASSEWQAEKPGTLTPQTPVTLVLDNGQGLVFRRTISVDADYMFKIVDEVTNRSAQPVAMLPYGRIFRLGTPKIEGFYIQHEGQIGFLGGKLQEVTYADALTEGGSKAFEKLTGGWLGFTDKYWAAALVPDQTKPFRANFVGTKKGAGAGDKESFQSDYLMDVVTVAPGQTQRLEQRLFAGAKQVNVVEGYQKSEGINQFSRLIDWGWFEFLTWPLFHAMDWINKLVGNFGVTILIVTLLVKLAFFPLANKSYESMAKMKKLQPEMELIRDRYKDDKARQQQELMALYSKQKINPLAGCLPILLQIPVFFALYKVLFISIDMRHAPFFGWIKDLSAPDPTSLFNLFGLLPFAPPEVALLHHTLGVWPLIMGATMWLQMQLNPQQPDPTQQMIFNWMPVLFTFMLAGFASGLVIYWAWNNVLSLAQQYYIMKKQGTDVPLVDNIKKTIAPLIGLVNGRKGAKE